jgi:chromosome segregation ATPase
VPKRIEGLRIKHGQLQSSLRHYEQKVEKQTRVLERMNRGDGWNEDEDEDEEFDEEGRRTPKFDEEIAEVTDEDLRREEAEIKELERRKKDLENRVSSMEKDLGGLLR